MHGDTQTLASFLCHCSCSALGLWFFIRRGKQCLDFTVTVHFFHMIGCWIYNAHLPAALSWWLVNIACMALMAVIGEYLCMRTELRAIPVNTGPKSNLWIFFGDWLKAYEGVILEGLTEEVFFPTLHSWKRERTWTSVSTHVGFLCFVCFHQVVHPEDLIYLFIAAH